MELTAIPGTVFHEVWSTAESPARVANDGDPTLGALVLPPPPGGTRIRFVDIPPDTEDFLKSGAGRMGEASEIAAACLYLASPEAGYVTGATLDINGGGDMM